MTMRIYHHNGAVKVLASPSKDGRADYSSDEARVLAAELTQAAFEADNYTAAVSHQETVNVPNPHAALEPAAEPVSDASPVLVKTGPSTTGTSTAPATTTSTKPKRVRSQAEKDAAAKKAREKRAAAKKAAK